MYYYEFFPSTTSKNSRNVIYCFKRGISPRDFVGLNELLAGNESKDVATENNSEKENRK